MEILTGIVTVLFCILLIVFWKYQRQVKDICRQLQFLKECDSNMLISREIDFGGIGELADTMNEILADRRRERGRWLEKEKSVSALYTNLSHDIRTPLTSLDGYFQLLEESGNERDRERYLKIIQERIESLKDMLEELFTFTRLENESYELELYDCCINQVLKNTIFSYYDNWEAEGIRPQFDITDDLLYVRGNVQAIRRIIQNILKNVLDHGESSLSVSLRCQEDNVILEIRNRVEHPEQIDVERVFERFYKEDSARSKSSTGLGLSIARELALRMDGRIEAFVEEDEFCVSLCFPPGRTVTTGDS